ncbi:hypothetical protein BD780_000522 [Clostridium tetanomorphum]|uniref:Uncharacterized protein n=1 Tax=Clostridium tetanomorphum TaxID=1553 RepID=A0A923E9S8_CLOTT|nr:hypothetical protein [Clostridium tetanomorphum]KAJ50363.1 cell wall-binding protein [Clostridium tetanomorphum DSM 665]MBC2397746.1 hypothetical protein [Clostridium tetanomorphum]MBP1866023.1 hypothetical protein [Clostridium tetanomorphum]NRS83297.1 hypothetical protein [Clostridium tetanomorphum]NRZ96501.1 hypothetical protein [Clostridium tetanomorphum]
MLKNKSLYIKLSLTTGIFFSLCSYAKAAEINKEIDDIHKTWNIKFNQEVNYDAETKREITIKDSNGNILETEINLKDGKTITVSSPKEGYKVGEIYTLNIGGKVRSKELKLIKAPRSYTFKIKEKISNPDTVDYKHKEIVNTTIDTTINSIEKKGIETEWESIALLKAGRIIPDTYIKKIEGDLKNSNGVLAQPTDYERMILGLPAAKADPTNVAGYNLLEKVYNNEDLESQGINAYVYGLIALDSKSYDVPDSVMWTRKKLVEAILDNRTKDKGWDFAGIKADPDMTGMALIALAPYKNEAEVKKAIDEGVKKLSDLQTENAAFSCYDLENCESICQVIMGLCANGIDPTEDRFVKNKKTMIDALMTFKTADGGFSHIRKSKKDSKATEQAVLALQAYKNLKENKSVKIY